MNWTAHYANKIRVTLNKVYIPSINIFYILYREVAPSYTYQPEKELREEEHESQVD